MDQVERTHPQTNPEELSTKDTHKCYKGDREQTTTVSCACVRAVIVDLICESPSRHNVYCRAAVAPAFDNGRSRLRSERCARGVAKGY